MLSRRKNSENVRCFSFCYFLKSHNAFRYACITSSSLPYFVRPSASPGSSRSVLSLCLCDSVGLSSGSSAQELTRGGLTRWTPNRDVFWHLVKSSPSLGVPLGSKSGRGAAAAALRPSGSSILARHWIFYAQGPPQMHGQPGVVTSAYFITDQKSVGSCCKLVAVSVAVALTGADTLLRDRGPAGCFTYLHSGFWVQINK